jgi:hypothetical protein
MPSEFYNEEEAEAILREASRRAPIGGAMSRDRLFQTAAELGIPPEAVIEAERVHREQAMAAGLAQEFRGVQKERFYNSFARPLIIGLIFLAVFFSTREEAYWALLIAMFLFLRTVLLVPKHLMPRSEIYQSEFEKWKRKRVKADQ